MGAKGSVEAAKLNAENWGHNEVCLCANLFSFIVSIQKPSRTYFGLASIDKCTINNILVVELRTDKSKL